MGICWKSISGRGNACAKALGQKMCLVCWRDSKEDSVAGAELWGEGERWGAVRKWPVRQGLAG